MKSCEPLVQKNCDYYLYTPSLTAQNTFLYPIQCGRFHYQPGYTIRRDSFDSILVGFLEKGSLHLELPELSVTAEQGSFFLIDCYQPHAYTAPSDASCLWCHFDGPTARSYCQAVISRQGHILQPTDSSHVFRKLESIFLQFHSGQPVREPLLSKYLTDILTAFLLSASPEDSKASGAVKTASLSHAGIAEEAIAYINDHFASAISLESLAAEAGLSLYYFLRVFKRETGYTPHEYLIHTRMAHARYLLGNTQLPIKEICYQSGFSNESTFCASFKQRQGMTPSQYQSLMQKP